MVFYCNKIKKRSSILIGVTSNNFFKRKIIKFDNIKQIFVPNIDRSRMTLFGEFDFQFTIKSTSKEHTPTHLSFTFSLTKNFSLK